MSTTLDHRASRLLLELDSGHWSSMLHTHEEYTLSRICEQPGMKLYLGCSQALPRKTHRFALGNDPEPLRKKPEKLSPHD